MSGMTDPNYLRNQQYKDAGRLNARVNLHAAFSTNTYGWFPWVFDQYAFPTHCRVLELGCGSGEIWRANQERIPAGWDITLSDFSEGMLAQARQNLEGIHPFAFEVIDVQNIPYEDQRFDAVIANHMLYHVPDRPRALAEIRRVLKPSERLYATTVGANHLNELFELTERFDTHAEDHLPRSVNTFTLETGLAQLQAVFSDIQVRRYEDTLRITEAAPLADYILSTYTFGERQYVREDLLDFIEQDMQHCGGAIDILKDSGIFIAS